MHTFIIKYLAFWVCGKIGYLERNDTVKKALAGLFLSAGSAPWNRGVFLRREKYQKAAALIGGGLALLQQYPQQVVG